MALFTHVCEPMFVSACLYIQQHEEFFSDFFSLAIENNFWSLCKTDILFSLNAIKADL